MMLVNRERLAILFLQFLAIVPPDSALNWISKDKHCV